MAIPPMDENLKQLLSAFNANHVKSTPLAIPPPAAL